MECAVCKKSNQEVELFEGITVEGIITLCALCGESEGIPLIKKPSEGQLERADERYSVRERMERMSGMKRTPVSDEQLQVQGNLARLRIPEKKETHEEVQDNYYWTLNMERRRRKMTINQLALKINESEKIMQSIERGKIPENFQEIFLKLESFLRIKLLKVHKQKINFTRSSDEEREILDAVRKKMNNPVTEEEEMLDELMLSEKKIERIERLSERKEPLNLSKRESLQDVTLNDLVERKKRQEQRMKKAKEDAMLGDDLEIEFEEP